MPKKKTNKFRSFYPVSETDVVKYPPVLVLKEDGDIGTLVPEEPNEGVYTDYSLQSLIDAGIPLTQAPQFDNSIEDVDSALQKLSNIKNQNLNENENQSSVQ